MQWDLIVYRGICKVTLHFQLFLVFLTLIWSVEIWRGLKLSISTRNFTVAFRHWNESFSSTWISISFQADKETSSCFHFGTLVSSQLLHEWSSEHVLARRASKILFNGNMQKNNWTVLNLVNRKLQIRLNNSHCYRRIPPVNWSTKIITTTKKKTIQLQVDFQSI